MLIQFNTNTYFHVTAKFVIEGENAGKIKVIVEDFRLDYNYEKIHNFSTQNEVVDFVKSNDHRYVLNQLKTKFGNVI